MSSAIGSVTHLMSVIRTHLNAGTQRARKQTRFGAAVQTGRRYGDGNLAALIATRTGKIDATDPQRGRKAFRIFLEVVLLKQLGEELMNDPAFYRLLDDVQSAMESDAHTAALIGQASDYLLAEHATTAPRPS